MFLLGLLVGILLVVLVMAWMVLRWQPEASMQRHRARMDIAAIERQTIHELLAETLHSQGRSGGQQDITEGTALDVGRRS